MKLCANEEDLLMEVLDQGAKRAQSVAEVTLREMKAKVGILRRL